MQFNDQTVLNDDERKNYVAIIYFLTGFTNSTLNKLNSGIKLPSEDASESSIQLTLDQGSPLIADLVVRKAKIAYSKLEENFVSKYNSNGALRVAVINITEPLYDRVNSLTEFVAPGTVAFLIFMSSTLFSSTRIIGERKQGIVERLRISGVSGSTQILAMIIVQSFILVIQVITLIMTSVIIFGTPLEGNLYLVILIVCLQGYTGIFLGILVSVICTEEAQVLQLVFGVMEMNYFLSGIMWPEESLPDFLKSMSNYLPLKIPAKALRFIHLRGWGLKYSDVRGGIFVNVLYGTGFLLLGILLRKFRKI